MIKKLSLASFDIGYRIGVWVLPRQQAWFLKVLIRGLIVGGVLAASAYIIPHLSIRQALVLVALVLGVGATILFLRTPAIGLALLIPTSLIAPLEISTGTNTGLHAGILLLFLLLGLWLLMAVARKELHFIRSGPELPLQLMVLTSVLAFAVGQLPWFPGRSAPMPAQLGGLSIFVLSAGAFLMAAYQIREMRWLQRMTWLFIAIGAVYILGRALPGMDQVVAGRYMQNGAAGSLFWVWLVALAFGQAFFNTRMTIWGRLALMCLVIVTLYVGVGESRGWKSGWVPPLVSVVTIMVLRWWHLGLALATIGAAPILGFVNGLIADDLGSYSTRLQAWQELLRLVWKNPLLGYGPSNYSFYTPKIFFMGGRTTNFNSHNQYIDVIAQTGILGLLCFLWFVWELSRLGWRLRTRAPDGFARGYVYGALGGLAGTLVAGMLGDWVLPFVYNIGFKGFRASVLGWIFLGGLVALQQMLAAENASSPTRQR